MSEVFSQVPSPACGILYSYKWPSSSQPLAHIHQGLMPKQVTLEETFQMAELKVRGLVGLFELKSKQVACFVSFLSLTVTGIILGLCQGLKYSFHYWEMSGHFKISREETQYS